MVGTALLLALRLLAGPGDYEPAPPEPKRIELGYNALEVAATTDASEGRARALTDLDVRIGDYVVGAWGLHEGDPCENASYFGRDVVTVGSRRTMLGEEGREGQRLAIILKTGPGGVRDTKIGVRDYDVPNALGDYGWFDISINPDGVNAFLYVGNAFGDWSLDLAQQIEMPFKGDLWAYSEMQGNRRFTEHLSGFARAEIPDFDLSDATYVAGITFSK